MLATLLKSLGLGLIAAVLGAIAGFLADPTHFLGFGAFAGLVTTVAGIVADLIRALADRLNPPAPPPPPPPPPR